MKRSAPRLVTRRLAASFVATVALLEGCKRAPVDDGPWPNPPATPPPETAATSASPNAVAHPSAVATPSAIAPPGVKLCSATQERPCIAKADDGTCTFLPAMVKCKPGGPPCNPPAIHRVPCP